jgi:hypothetical protein
MEGFRAVVPRYRARKAETQVPPTIDGDPFGADDDGGDDGER